MECELFTRAVQRSRGRAQEGKWYREHSFRLNSQWQFGLERLSLLLLERHHWINPITVFSIIHSSSATSGRTSTMSKLHQMKSLPHQHLDSSQNVAHKMFTFLSSPSLPLLVAILNSLLPPMPIPSTVIPVCPECYIQRQNTIRGAAYEMAVQSCHIIQPSLQL